MLGKLMRKDIRLLHSFHRELAKLLRRPAGSLVALLIWIYYSCAILFYGAEFIYAHRLDAGLAVEPKKTAVLVRKEIVKESGSNRRKVAA